MRGSEGVLSAKVRDRPLQNRCEIKVGNFPTGPFLVYVDIDKNL